MSNVTARASKLFIGVGNELRRDDGVGVSAARAMASLPLPPDVEVYEAGLAGADITWALERRELVVVADAIDAGAEPGAVFRLTPEQLHPAVTDRRLSLHDFHLLDALDQARLLGTAPAEVVVLVVQVAEVGDGIGLTPPVERSLDVLVSLAIEALGVPSHVPRCDSALV